MNLFFAVNNPYGIICHISHIRPINNKGKFIRKVLDKTPLT